MHCLISVAGRHLKNVGFVGLNETSFIGDIAYAWFGQYDRSPSLPEKT